LLKGNFPFDLHDEYRSQWKKFTATKFYGTTKFAGSQIYFAHPLGVSVHTPVYASAFACVRWRRARFMPPFAGVYLGMAARFRGWIAASPTVNFAPRRIFVGDYSPQASKIRDDETEHHRVSFGRLAEPGERPRSFPEFRWDTSPGRTNTWCTTGFFSDLTSVGSLLTTTYFTTHHRNVNYALPVAGTVKRDKHRIICHLSKKIDLIHWLRYCNIYGSIKPCKMNCLRTSIKCRYVNLTVREKNNCN